jgi:hypothetical protein
VVRFTVEERVEVWDRWQADDGYRLIGRDLGRSAASLRAFVESWGGVRPEPRRRSPRHLSLLEREEISRGWLLATRYVRSEFPWSCCFDDQPGTGP